MKLWDVKYKGERVIYELGLSEAMAHYAGNDPVQSGTAYADTFYVRQIFSDNTRRFTMLNFAILRQGFGPYAFELVEGYDCPTYSKFVDTTFHANEVSTTHKKSICFFENDESYPMTRHANGQYVAATKNIAFKMRSASTVGNYGEPILLPQPVPFAKHGSFRLQITVSPTLSVSFLTYTLRRCLRPLSTRFVPVFIP